MGYPSNVHKTGDPKIEYYHSENLRLKNGKRLPFSKTEILKFDQSIYSSSPWFKPMFLGKNNERKLFHNFIYSKPNLNKWKNALQAL